MTKEHVTTLTKMRQSIGIDPKHENPGRAVVRHIGDALVDAMKMVRAAGNPAAAELVACECIVNAETKDYLDWELISKCADHLDGEKGEALEEACEKVEDQEDEHLYHTKSWYRELWLESLGLTAILPPPEERLHVKTAIAAAKVEQSADKRADHSPR